MDKKHPCSGCRAKTTNEERNEKMNKIRSELADITGSQEMALKIFDAILHGRLTGVVVNI